MYEKLERLTRKRWFYLLVFLIPVILPPFAGTGLGYLWELPDFIQEVSYALYDVKAVYAPAMPLLHLLMLLLILALAIFRGRFGRLFAALVGLNFALTAVVQTGVLTGRYGLVILTQIFLWYLLVILLWFWEALIRKNDYSFKGGTLRPYWLIPLAVFAFWDPDQAWNLDPAFFINGFAPTAFCMISPIYLTVILFAHPRLNLPLLRLQSFVGLIVGFISLVISFMQEPSAGIYWALLHTPLIAASWYGFRLGMRTLPESDVDAVRVAGRHAIMPPE